MKSTIEIDGSFGEGGGQILRTSVALSAITSIPLAIKNIRAKRKKPGLMRQHFAAINAAKEICNAKVSGLELHSSAITFEPGRTRPGEYHFRIGTAGSTSLVLQTILMPLLLADMPSTVQLEGGTHNPMAPPFDFLERSFAPQLRAMGVSLKLNLERFGFFPAGGGQVSAAIRPIDQWRGLDLMARGELKRRSVRAVVANLPGSIASRELKRIQRATEWPHDQFKPLETKESNGPGNVVVIELNYENVTALFTGFGRIGRRAEAVAMDTLREARDFLRTEAPVCEHLADQLLLPMAIAADQANQSSRFVTHTVSSHTETHIELIKKFIDVTIEVQQRDDGCFEVGVKPSSASRSNV